MSVLQLRSIIGLGGKSALAARLSRYGQDHLVRYWAELSDTQRRRLADQIDAIDFQLLAQLVRDETARRRSADAARRAEPPPAIRHNDPDRPRLAADARRLGDAALRAGKIGVIIVAGGQGTRLGCQCPKGTIPVGPVSDRSLLQVLIDRILAVGQRYGVHIPLYLMTSLATHAPTVAYLEQHNRFGLSPQHLHLFQQGVMPAVSAETGKVLMAARDSICLAPNGHGGMIEALAASGGLDAAAASGIEHLFYCQVDNPLAPCCDPELIGFHLAAGSEMTTLAVPKSDPQERVGNIVSIDGQVQILEYSELPSEIGSDRNADGSLRLWAGNTAIHLFNVEFLSRVAASPEALPYHGAKKEIPCLDAQGQLAAPTGPNAIKFERFIFDLLPQARSALVVEGAKEVIFAPVKNASGAAFDTPETAQAAMSALYRRWLQAAGVNVADDAVVEINPRFALDAEELAAKLPPGWRMDGSVYLE